MRILYAWEKDNKFYLSAFKFARPDNVRPAMEFNSKEELLKEVKIRSTEVQWDGES